MKEYDGKHWKDAELHFEWRQRVLDEMLAKLSDVIARTVNVEDVATLCSTLIAWSKAQGDLDKDVLVLTRKPRISRYGEEL